MSLRKILAALALAITLLLVVESAAEVDVAPTKNNHLTSFLKADVDTIRHIDTVKALAKASYDRQRERARTESSRARIRICLLLVLIGIQCLFFFQRDGTKRPIG
ncbi:MAG: hypothetical protein EOO12_12010 [Chitinophagaceae bacterium]|nr:MAG: hypothetical protein EOO12_12010 [Chitinophagaceae bacterium]